MSETRFLKIDAVNPEADIIKLAANYIKKGELVAFPTETVYGLGADVFQAAAVNKIFLAKGRPPEKALLVHVSNSSQVARIAAEISPAAHKLMDRFWPGPLSLILPSLPAVPAIVRNGQAGIGLRMPAHPVALALIEATGPLAAPSANLYGRPSPTNARHVSQDLEGKIALILDGGETGAGMESTLLDLSQGQLVLLRLGGTPVELIEACLGETVEIKVGTVRQPYKTKVKVILTDTEDEFEAILADKGNQNVLLGVVGINGYPASPIEAVRYYINIDMATTQLNIYAIIRDAEENGVEELIFAPVDPEQTGNALMDRLQRAASP